MKKIINYLMLGVALLLSACDVGVSRSVVVPERIPSEVTEQPPKVVTLAPEFTATAVAAAPEAQAQAADTPWKDCALLPGWVGCDQNAEKLAAWLAFFNPNGPAVVAVDLGSDAGWHAAAKPARMEWSPQEDRLMVSLGEKQYQVYGADGALVEEFSSEITPQWQPDNSLGREGHVRSAQGDEAWLEALDGGNWRLHVKAAGGEEQGIDLVSPSPDLLYQLVSWIPGTQQVLGQVYTADNAAMLQGGRLVSIDAQNGAMRDLEAYAPLGWQAEFAWKEPGPVLAFGDSGTVESGAPTLGILDFGTGSLSYPLPEGVQVSGMDWTPDGAALAFAASTLGQMTPAEGFGTPGIYRLDAASGEVKALTQPPEGARDDLPYFTPDASVLLYARRFEAGVMEVHALRLADGTDWVILSGLPAPCEIETGCDWRSWVGIGSQ